MLTSSEIFSLKTEAAVIAQIQRRQILRTQMIGVLYPRIIDEEVEQLCDLLQRLIADKKSTGKDVL